MKNITSALIIALLLIGCENKHITNKANEDYLIAKKSFDADLTSHFPEKLTVFPNTVINNKNFSKNNISFMLYEFSVHNTIMDSIGNHLKKHDVTHYSFKDSCLFVVNRFETRTTYENREKIHLIDTTLTNRPCYKNMMPIPNFDAFNGLDNSDLGIDESFLIYVLESKKGNQFPEFKVRPNIQMPEEWKNGYSKGVAISQQKRTIVYWAIVW